MQFGRPRTLTHAELDAAAGNLVERRHPLRHTVRLVGRQLDNAMPQPDVLGPLARRGEENFRSRRVGIFLQEMVLDLPHVVVAQFVG